MNKIVIIGNLGRDPELKTLDDGTAVCSFNVAIERGRDKPPQWVSVSAWRKQAEICAKYLHKGSKVCVVGSAGARAWIGKDGGAKASLELQATDIEFLTPKGSPAEEQPPVDAASGYTQVDPEDLPY